MKDEIKEILDKISSEKYYIQHSYCRLFNYEANALLDYITNLQETLKKKQQRIKELLEETYSANQVVNELLDIEEENKKLKEDIEDISVSHFSLFKQYEDYKSRNEKAVEDIDLVIELIKQQPTEDDTWILNRLNGFKYLLQGEDKDE